MADQAAVNNALGTILGYLGAEIAPPNLFDRLLWPQRFYNGFRVSSIPKLALLMPMGGPLHRAALATFDNIMKNDLLKGEHLGHMLDSPFYADSKLKYTIHDGSGNKEGVEHVRNALWARVVDNLPIPSTALLSHTQPQAIEGGNTDTRKIRAFHKVSYLKLSAVDSAPKGAPCTRDETGAARPRIYAALLVTELSSIAVGVVVFAVWESLFGFIWFIPILLKLVSAAAALRREPLQTPSLSSMLRRQSTLVNVEKSESDVSCSVRSSDTLSFDEPATKVFEIHNEKHGFLLVEAPEDVVLQFFRHYGHPIRDRFLESVQLLMIIGMGCVFPVGLICCLVWMPVSLQYLWLAYQLYTTLAMHIYRFAGGPLWATTEEQLIHQFTAANEKGEPLKAYLGGPQGAIMAELSVTYHGRYAEGKAHLEKLLRTRKEELAFAGSDI